MGIRRDIEDTAVDYEHQHEHGRRFHVSKPGPGIAPSTELEGIRLEVIQSS
jgi:hypothetical protein